MEKELQSKMVEILTSIQTAAGKASDFALTELPDIAQSYIVYGRAVTLVYLVLGICGAIGGVALIRRAVAEDAKGYSNSNDFVTFMCGAGGIVAVILGAIVSFLELQAALLVWFAPKVWLLTKLAALIK